MDVACIMMLLESITGTSGAGIEINIFISHIIYHIMYLKELLHRR